MLFGNYENFFINCSFCKNKNHILSECNKFILLLNFYYKGPSANLKI